MILQEGVSNLLFTAYYKAEKKNKVKTKVILIKLLKVIINKTYIYFFSENSSSNIKDSFIENNNDDH